MGLKNSNMYYNKCCCVTGLFMVLNQKDKKCDLSCFSHKRLQLKYALSASGALAKRECTNVVAGHCRQFKRDFESI